MKVQVSALSLAVGLVLGGVATPLLAQDAPLKVAGIANGPCMEGICEYQLKNGLKVLLFPDASKPVTTVNIAYGVGSVQEGFGETGMAHLLEHMLFKGTPTVKDIPEEMKKRSMSFNATTSFDRTNYFASFPADADRLKWALDLEAERMTKATFGRSQLDSEMTVVRNEMERGENSNGRILRERLFSTAFLWHPYRRSTIGARSDVENVGIDNLRAFYNKWYRPDNATLVVAGDFDAAKTLPLIDSVFGKIKNPAGAVPKNWTVEPTQDGEREVLLKRPGDERITFMGYHTPSAMHPDSAALGVLSIIMNDVPNGRLYKALVEPKIAAGASLGTMKLRDPALTIASVQVDKTADLAKAEAILMEQVQDLSKNPITQEELDLALQKLQVARERMTENVNSIGQSLTESIALGDWRMLFYQVDESLKVKLADVNRVAAAYFKPSNRTIARYIPTDNPDRSIIAAALPASEVVKNYKGGAAIAAGEVFELTPENVTKRTESFNLGPDLKVNLLPKKTRGNTVIVDANFRFASIDDIAKTSDAALVGSMLQLGSKQYDREAIKNKLIALKSSGSASGSMQGAGISLNSKRDTVNDAVLLLAEVLREPTVPVKDFGVVISQALTGMETQRKEPGFVAGQAMSKHFNVYPAGHPLAYQTLDEQLAKIKSLTPEQLREYHKSFYGTNIGEISVVGDFDPASMKETLKKAFGNWNAPKPWQPVPTKYTAIAPETVKINTPDKANAIVIARQNLSLNSNDPDYFPMMIADDILGSGMDSRMSARLRVKEGLTYGVGTNIVADSSVKGRDDNGYLTISGTMAPENAEKFVASMRDELARFVRDGVTDAEVKKAVSVALEQRRVRLSSDSGLASILNRNSQYSESMTDYAKRTELLSKVTAADVNRAIRKLIKPDQMSVYMAGDFEKAAAK